MFAMSHKGPHHGNDPVYSLIPEVIELQRKCLKVVRWCSMPKVEKITNREGDTKLCSATLREAHAVNQFVCAFI